MAELPPASLIISSRGRPELLTETVESILAGDELPQELILIDQSNDENRELAAMRSDRCDLRYVHMERTGVSVGRNEGVRLARHELLVFTDDDVIVDRSWFGAIVRALMAEGDRSVVVGRVLAGPAEQQGAFMWDENDFEQRVVYEGRGAEDPLYPTNMALYRSSIETVGLYDERLGPGTRFPAAEDNDLAFRLLETGYRIVFVPEPVVTHRAWRPPEEFLKVKWRNARGQGAFLAKHLSLRDRHMLLRLLRQILRETIAAPRGLLTFRREGRGHAVSALGIALGACTWLLAVRLPSSIRRVLRRRPSQRQTG
jgi:GT2 family glycosyltransferase